MAGEEQALLWSERRGRVQGLGQDVRAHVSGVGLEEADGAVVNPGAHHGKPSSLEALDP